MMSYYKKYSWVIIAMLCIIGGTVYYMITGGAGFTMGTDDEKIGIVYGDESLFINYSDMESAEMVDIPTLGDAVDGGTGNNTMYGKFKDASGNEVYAFVYTKQEQCIKVVFKDGVLYVNDSTKKKTNTLFEKLTKEVGNE